MQRSSCHELARTAVAAGDEMNARAVPDRRPNRTLTRTRHGPPGGAPNPDSAGGRTVFGTEEPAMASDTGLRPLDCLKAS